MQVFHYCLSQDAKAICLNVDEQFKCINELSNFIEDLDYVSMMNSCYCRIFGSCELRATYCLIRTRILSQLKSSCCHKYDQIYQRFVSHPANYIKYHNNHSRHHKAYIQFQTKGKDQKNLNIVVTSHFRVESKTCAKPPIPLPTLLCNTTLHYTTTSIIQKMEISIKFAISSDTRKFSTIVLN